MLYSPSSHPPSSPPPSWLDTLTLLAPALAVLVLVSSQTGFNRYLRYVLPAFPYLFIWGSQAARMVAAATRRQAFGCGLAAAALSATAVSSLSVFPHELSYFNELAGGPLNGPAHLLDANVDWGQDFLELKRWYDGHPEARPLHVAWFGFVDPKIAGIEYEPVPKIESDAPEGAPSRFHDSLAGWHAVSVDLLYGYKHSGGEEDVYAWLRKLTPVAHAGYSIRIFHVTHDDAAKFRNPSADGVDSRTPQGSNP